MEWIFMKSSRISEKILLGACRILLEWERTYANLDECIDQMRSDQVEGRSAIASLLFEYFRHKDFIDRLIADRARKGAVKAELRVRDGWHSWEYWHTALRLALPFASRNFAK